MVSVVVTSYNYEKYILKTLESIKSQTYNNFEIIISIFASLPLDDLIKYCFLYKFIFIFLKY